MTEGSPPETRPPRHTKSRKDGTSRKVRADKLVITDDHIRMIERMAERAFPINQICYLIGISPVTWQRRCKEDPRISEAYERGRANGKSLVVESAFNQAISEKSIEATKFWLERQGGAEWKPPPKEIALSYHPNLLGPDGQPLSGDALRAKVTELVNQLNQPLQLPEAIDAEVIEDNDADKA